MRAPAIAVTAFVSAIGLAGFGSRAAAVAGELQAATPAQATAAPAAGPKATPEALDKLLAPVALYPDQLLAQVLLCAATPAKVQELSGWLIRNTALTGTELQDAAQKQGFEASFVVLALFPQVVNYMADNIAWTTELGQAFSADREGVMDSVQRLRAEAKKVGNLKTTPQQKVETKTTTSGEQVIVIEPANPQVVYVPQYNPHGRLHAAGHDTTVVVQEESNSTGAAVAGAAVGFAAGIAIGAAMDNDYYYGPYGWHGGAVHVQRRLGRLLRRPRGRARGLLREPRGRAGRHRGRPARTCAENAVSERPREHGAGAADRAARRRAQRASAASGTGTASTQAAAHGSAGSASATTQARGSGAASAEARGTRRDAGRQASARSERHEVGRLLRILERQVRTRGQLARRAAAGPAAAAAARR